MDCEKFDSILIDELYGELDELTSAAAKRHAASCARCSAALNGLRATRRLAEIPTADSPSGLENRILAAALGAADAKSIALRDVAVRASEVHGVPASDGSNGSRAAKLPAKNEDVRPSPFLAFLSRAGAWAMRPQTAMAAIFVVMVGSSVVFLQSKSMNATSSSSVTVTEQGAPAPPSEVAPLDQAPVPSPTVPSPTVATNEGLLQAQKDDKGRAKSAASAFAQAPPAQTSNDELRTRSARKESESARELARAEESASGSGIGGFAEGPRGAAGGAANAEPRMTMPSRAAKPESAPAAAAPAPASPGAPPPPVAKAAPADEAADRNVDGRAPTFAEAMKVYQAGDYSRAATMFDALAPTNLQAALYAARSVRMARGCGQAAPRYEQVVQRGAGQRPAADALWEVAGCYRTMGSIEAAKDRLRRLLADPVYANRARAELQSIEDAQNPAKGRQ